MSNIEEDIMSEEAFNELIDNFEIVNTLTEYGRKAIKQNVKKLQKRIKELEEENKKYTIKLTDEEYRRVIEIAQEDIKKQFEQKVKDVLIEIREEYDKAQEQFDIIWDKKSKDNHDRYKLQELSAMQQELGFILGKLELLEEK